jgi:hypothetical protein
MRLISPPVATASLPDLIIRFNAEIIQGHREAFQALREIMAEAAALATPPSEASPADGTPQARAAANAVTRRLSLRLKAATAILRVKPIKDAEESVAARVEKVGAARSGAECANAGSPSTREASSGLRERKEASRTDSQDSDSDTRALQDPHTAAFASTAFPDL